MCFVFILEQTATSATYPINWLVLWERFNRLQPTGHYMYLKFNIQQMYALPTMYLCVLYLS